MYCEHSLCFVKKEASNIGLLLSGNFKGDKFYRVLFDSDKKGCIVYGEWMSMDDFNANFELVIPELQKRLALLLGDKKVSFAEFKRRADVHTYGLGLKAIKIVFIGTKNNRFGFYPMQGNMTESLKESYQLYVKLFEGDFEVIDSEDVQWGNCGIPISYSDLRVQNFNEPII